jgi:Na+/glutamate symporter
VYVFAHNQAAWYGLIAIAIAVSAGWGAAAAFRKR